MQNYILFLLSTRYGFVKSMQHNNVNRGILFEQLPTTIKYVSHKCVGNNRNRLEACRRHTIFYVRRMPCFHVSVTILVTILEVKQGNSISLLLVHIHTHTYIHTPTPTHIHTHIHTHTDTHTHTHTHMIYIYIIKK